MMLLRENSDLHSDVLVPLMHCLEQSFGEGETLVVLPEGISLNFYLRSESPMPYTNFMPPELIILGAENILADLNSEPPD